MSHLTAGGAKGFNMHHDNVEATTDRLVAEGANVQVSYPAAIKLARLERPQDMPSLHVEGLSATVSVIVGLPVT
jgi:hypothetical protein